MIPDHIWVEVRRAVLRDLELYRADAEDAEDDVVQEDPDIDKRAKDFYTYVFDARGLGDRLRDADPG